jgi:hypothetical protein
MMAFINIKYMQTCLNDDVRTSVCFKFIPFQDEPDIHIHVISFIADTGKNLPYHLVKEGNKIRIRTHIKVLIQRHIHTKNDGKNYPALQQQVIITFMFSP